MPKSYFLQYKEKIDTGKIIAGNKILKQLQNCYDLLKNTKCELDVGKGHSPIKFIEKYLFHFEGKFAGKPFKLQLWQKAWIEVLYGFIDKKTNQRQFTEVFFVVARKNGKSMLAAAIALYSAVFDGEMGAQVYTAATSKDQASISFDAVKKMVKASPYLSSITKITQDVLYFEKTNSKLKRLSADYNSLDGLNSSFNLIDEIHAHKKSALYAKKVRMQIHER